MTTDYRYGLASWKRRRAAHLREHPLCVMCDQLSIVTVASVADHVEPHRGNDAAFWTGALQSLCSSCHSTHKQRAEKSGRTLGNSTDGAPLDPSHHWNQGE